MIQEHSNRAKRLLRCNKTEREKTSRQHPRQDAVTKTVYTLHLSLLGGHWVKGCDNYGMQSKTRASSAPPFIRQVGLTTSLTRLRLIYFSTRPDSADWLAGCAFETG